MKNKTMSTLKKEREKTVNIKSKKIKGKDIVFLIGRGINCKCSDCPVLYGGDCPTLK